MSKMSCVCDDGEAVDLVSSYLKGRIKKMQKHADGEVDDIADCMTKLRAKCNHSLAWGAGVPMYISFYGWGNDFERSVFLRCLKHSLPLDSCTRPSWTMAGSRASPSTLR